MSNENEISKKEILEVDRITLLSDFNRLKDYKSIMDDINDDFSNVRDSFISLGYNFKKLKDDNLYKMSDYDDFDTFCKSMFGMSQSVVYRYIQVYERFGNGKGQLLDDYEGYSFSQLTELLSIPDSDFNQYDPSLTVKDIRESKKNKKIIKELKDELTTLNFNTAISNFINTIKNIVIGSDLSIEYLDKKEELEESIFYYFMIHFRNYNIDLKMEVNLFNDSYNDGRIEFYFSSEKYSFDWWYLKDYFYEVSTSKLDSFESNVFRRCENYERSILDKKKQQAEKNSKEDYKGNSYTLDELKTVIAKMNLPFQEKNLNVFLKFLEEINFTILRSDFKCYKILSYNGYSLTVLGLQNFNYQIDKDKFIENINFEINLYFSNIDFKLIIDKKNFDQDKDWVYSFYNNIDILELLFINDSKPLYKKIIDFVVPKAIEQFKK